MKNELDRWDWGDDAYARQRGRLVLVGLGVVALVGLGVIALVVLVVASVV